MPKVTACEKGDPLINRANGLTRQAILTEIKRRGSVTTDELGQDLGISSVAVRQHLSTLSAEGKVSITVERRGLGRPVHRYQLTADGDETFDRAYDKLSIDLLESLHELQGEQGVDTVLGVRRKKLVSELFPRIQGLPIENRVGEIAKLQDGFGFMASAAKDGDDVVLIEHNCAICRTAQRFPALCSQELTLFCELAGPDVDVNRERHILSGDVACVYRFSPKATAPVVGA
jgi:predicted ArsR family transcriptional regulator